MRIDYPIIVEGKYDKIKLDSIVDATIIQTDGFGLFNDREKLALIRKMAQKSPIIVLTDSDGAGAVIRGHIASAIPPDRLIHLYTPAVRGKERRKDKPSKAGTLGVEGIDADKLRALLAPFAVDGADGKDAGTLPPREKISKADFYACGMSGTDGSRAAREAFCRHMELPPDMSPNALLAAVNVLLSRDEFYDAVNALRGGNVSN